MACAEAKGWPRVRLRPAVYLRSGRDAYARFLATASADDLTELDGALTAGPAADRRSPGIVEDRAS
jgi:hypothetical protein